MKLLLSCMISIFTISVSAQKSEQMKWVAGIWKISSGNNSIVEQWTITNDSMLTGKSFFVKDGKDSIQQESLELSFRNGNWNYISTVAGQNNNQPVYFKIIFLKGAEFIAENPAHDFPQRIAYRRIKNQLFASIEGRNNGKYGKKNFDFTTE
jgi:hypothetical protein